MWVVFLANEIELNYFSKNLKSTHESVSTAFGAKILKAKTPSHVHFVAAASPDQSSKLLLDWVVHNLMPSAFLSSSVCSPLKAGISSEYFLPTLCLRTTGRTEIGGGPLLYEEINFDTKLVSTLHDELKTVAMSGGDKIFSMPRFVVDDEERAWVAFHLSCDAIDHYTGELLSAAKRLGFPVACLKYLDTSPNALDKFFATWSKLRSDRDRSL